MDEQLVCTLCEKTWTRLKTRGRKPNLCPLCLSLPVSQEPIQSQHTVAQPTEASASKGKPFSIYQHLYPRPSNYKDLIESTKSGSVWKCPSCGHVLTLLVPVSDVPTHRCTPNTVTVKAYQRIS